MTRPIFEPTPARTDASLGYSSRQLFRRPAPTSGSSAYAWARFQRVNDSDINVPNNTNTVVGGTAGSDIITDTSIFQINSNLEIEMLVDGLIAIYGQTFWSSYDATWRQISVFDVAPVVDYPIAMGGSADDLYDSAIVSGTVRVTTGAKLRLVAHQTSGGGQTIYGGGSDIDETNFLEIQYLGGFQAAP